MTSQNLAAMGDVLQIREFVTRLWCDVLHTQTLAEADNFFKLGGHSLTALRVISEVEQSFQVELGGMREMCENPTLGEFVSLVVDLRGSPREAVGDG